MELGCREIKKKKKKKKQINRNIRIKGKCVFFDMRFFNGVCREIDGGGGGGGGGGAGCK